MIGAMSRQPNGSSGNDLSRREAMSLAGSVVLAALAPGCRAPGPPLVPLATPLCFSSASMLAQAIGRKQVSSEEVTRACLERIAAVNSALNAVVQIDHDGALRRARDLDTLLAKGAPIGPLHGVPMTIKDSLDTAGMISTGGTSGRRAYVPTADATVVSRLKAAGAVLMGKTNTPELTFSYETSNPIYGTTNNPHALGRTPGGSSGGAAAIVSAGGSPFDIGSDYGGSIRQPAHFCGLAGLKPSAGRVPRTGNIVSFGGVTDVFQQIGPLARSADDLALLLPLIMGPDAADPFVVPQPWSRPAETRIDGLRIAFHTDNGIATPTADIVATVRAAARALADANAVVTEAVPTAVEQTSALGLPVYGWDEGASIQRMLAAAGTTESTFGTFPPATPVPPERLDALFHALDLWRSGMTAFFSGYDVILCPVAAVTAVPHGGASDPVQANRHFSYCMTYNLTGWPAAVVRAGTSPEGLPIGVQIVAHPGRDDVALAVAKFVEIALGGYQPPSLPAS